MNTEQKTTAPQWHQEHEFFTLSMGSVAHAALPRDVYNVQFAKQLGMFLERRPMGFTLPAKVYGLEEAFIARVCRTYEHTRGNLGVLLNGLRGTGKTITAELLALKLGLPVVLVSQDYPGLIDFMDSIPHDVCFLCDEFEKVFPNLAEEDESSSKGSLMAMQSGGQNERGASKFLPLMDGVMNSGHRRVFILTTNRLRIEPNLIQRPGRIRYLKTFGNLARETIEMIVDDLLVARAARKEVIEYIAQLELITVDIVCRLVEEMNIHGGSPEALDDLFNVRKLDLIYDVTRVDRETMDEETGKARWSCKVVPVPDADAVGSTLYVDQREVGRIVEVKGEYVEVVTWKLETEKEERLLLRLKPRPNYNRESFGRGFGGFDARAL